MSESEFKIRVVVAQLSLTYSVTVKTERGTRLRPLKSARCKMLHTGAKFLVL